MWKISKEFHFSASHTLEGLPDEHPCSRMHGHNYVVTIELVSKELDGPGFILDYRALEPIKKYIDSKLDHRHLNDVMPVNPTAELIAKHLFDEFTLILIHLRSSARISSITVKETEKTMAKYYKNYDDNPNFR